MLADPRSFPVESLVRQFCEICEAAAWRPEIRCVVAFGDLLWPPLGMTTIEFATYSETEPAFMVVGRSRYVAIARLAGQIRFLAMPVGADDIAPDLVERHEMGVVDSVADAVAFARDYLDGRPLTDIPIRRHR